MSGRTTDINKDIHHIDLVCETNSSMMERWSGKVALVTGASSGIGMRIAQTLAKHDMKVIAVARRIEKLQKLAADVQQNYNAKLHTVRCDVEKEEDILEVFKWAEEHVGGVDVLINNAGVLSLMSLSGDFFLIKQNKSSTFLSTLLPSFYFLSICREKISQNLKY